ncbi:MAG: hypothetical protein ACTMUB_09680 [cyanobacterium endosymbiont of Rhopalodia musculus]|uniref:hypothetical protein n=1 Tax=cyanobacterium endosymbiont of Epithemia clementina EcSB TaxID=3034674 RepID=UPI0024815728|nr:hypothetical protein [cyanobacterium endosymbiont of Epithemia clementina EcSB]WGT68312.1 hypothetical protein P3F56_04465 [cyanobacterium endosymbiont of Epithemia clementina EcSB]
MNSDLAVFMMSILPMLKSSVVIEIHDIMLCCDYSNEFKNWYWNEQGILGVYLLIAANLVKILVSGRSIFFLIRNGVSSNIQNWKKDRNLWLGVSYLWFSHIEKSYQKWIKLIYKKII